MKTTIKRRLLDGTAVLIANMKVFNSLQLARRKRLVMKAKRVMKDKTFLFNGTNLPYSYFPYNSTYANERCIEVSIGKWFMDTHDDVLEIGNVMNHYYPVPHEVVDKYEVADGVRNEDVVNLRDKHKNILALSTLEHVGLDEDGDHTKFHKALANLKALATGHILITVPWGVNPSVDEFVGNFKGTINFYYRERREWKEGTLEDITPRIYGSRYNCANAIAVIQLG